MQPSLPQEEASAPKAARHPLDPHLKALENEAIHIFREVAAEFDNPVMLYSIGKDSSVLLHLARKGGATVAAPITAPRGEPDED